MTSEPVMPKRKRSRPSEWWTAAPTSNRTQQDVPRPTKRGQLSNPGEQRMILEAPAAGNWGNRRKYVIQEGAENEEASKPLRRGRSSYTEAEMVAAADLAAEIDDANKRKRGRPAQSGNKGEVSQPVRSGRSSNTEAELEAGRAMAVGDDTGLKKRRGRPAAMRTDEDELLDEPIGNERETQKPSLRAEKQGKNIGVQPAKKKRGRSAIAQEPDELLGETAKSHTVSKKQGRPVVTEAEEQGDADLLNVGQTGKKRGGRPRSVSKAGEQPLEPRSSNEAEDQSKQLRHGQLLPTQNESEVVADIATKPPGEKKRGRPSRADAELDDITESPVEKADDGSAKPVRRGRSSNTGAELQAMAEPVYSTRDKGTSKRKKGQSDVEIAGSAATVGRTLRDRRSDTVVALEGATSSFARDRNVPKKGNNRPRVVGAETRKGTSSAQEPSKSKRTQSSKAGTQETEETRPRGKTSKQASKLTSKRRREEEEEVVEEPSKTKRRRVGTEPQTDEPPMYAHLAPVTRRVSRRTIELKWEPLPPACVERISQMVHDLQRPVVVHLNDDRKRTEANTTLHMISRRLISKISKGLPFPPAIRSSREEDFDFEKILDRNRALEALLTPALHRNELLEAELAKETAQLESEHAGLVVLEANAKSQAIARKEAERKMHSLLQSDSTSQEDDQQETLELVDGFHSILPFSHTEDEDLQDLAKELSGHLDSIQGNINRVEGISEAMTVARSAVENTLFGALESNQYEHIVLG